MRIPENSSAFPPYQRGKAVEVIVNGQKVWAYEGELVSTILHEQGILIFDRKPITGRGSGLYCGMGVCYECLVTVDGVRNVRACRTLVADQMVVETELEHP